MGRFIQNGKKGSESIIDFNSQIPSNDQKFFFYILQILVFFFILRVFTRLSFSSSWMNEWMMDMNIFENFIHYLSSFSSSWSISIIIIINNDDDDDSNQSIDLWIITISGGLYTYRNVLYLLWSTRSIH